MIRRMVFFLLLTGIALAGDQQKVIILHTTDVHGSILPYDYFRDQPSQNGLAKVYTMVQRYRAQNDNVLLLDTGDLIQGTPLSYYFNHVETSRPNPLPYVMNYMRYDAFAVGNHDIEQGYPAYTKARRESDFPWLSANGLFDDGSTFFKPYAIIHRDGIRIGLIGLTTPGIPMWLDPSLYPGLHWADMVETARYWAAEIRPQVDVLIGMFHAGMNEEYSMAATEALGLPNENACTLVAEAVPGFDLILTGHAHQVIPKDGESVPVVNGAALMQSGSHARYLGVAEIILEDKKVTSVSAQVLPVDTVDSDPEITALMQPYHEQTLTYIREQIGTVADTLSGRLSRMQDTPLMDLIHAAQLEASGAEISLAASFNERFLLAPGAVRVKDIYGIYRYENFLYAVEMTGKQLKDYLEYSAGYFTWDAENKAIAINPKMAGYNYDMAQGLSYKIDVNAPAGQRIRNLRLSKNDQPLDEAKTYTVAMNSYRATGGGGHLAAAGIKQAKVVWKSSEEMRNILAEYIRQIGAIPVTADGNWALATE